MWRRKGSLRKWSTVSEWQMFMIWLRGWYCSCTPPEVLSLSLFSLSQKTVGFLRMSERCYCDTTPSLSFGVFQYGRCRITPFCVLSPPIWQDVLWGSAFIPGSPCLFSFSFRVFCLSIGLSLSTNSNFHSALAKGSKLPIWTRAGPWQESGRKQAVCLWLAHELPGQVGSCCYSSGQNYTKQWSKLH